MMPNEVQDPPLAVSDTAGSGRDAAEVLECYHCGAPCGRMGTESEGKRFCCVGCLTVHDLLRESGLGGFYELHRHPGVRVGDTGDSSRWAYLDDPEVERRLLDYSDARTSKVTFQVPGVHCVACVWLLENLFQLHPAVGRSRVDFARREVSVDFAPDQIRLSGVAALLASLGYEPSVTLGHLEGRAGPDRARQRQVLQTGVAGFAFGNIMLFSLPNYLGLDSLSGPLLQQMFGWLSLVLGLPVLVFSASDYWRSALASFRQRRLTLDVPIAMGLAALYGQSAWEILGGTGEGYMDTLAGLVFFLLCGRWFQQVSHARLAFDRDYRSFFPLAVTRRRAAGGDESAALSTLGVGDRLILRHGELIPADAVLVEGRAVIDYSFVTGEAEPVERRMGQVVYAGGRQTAGAIEVETVKPVSQSYLASLWSHEAFQKPARDGLDNLTNRFSRGFTLGVVLVAVGAAAGWSLAGEPGRGVKAFVSVLIVACPCALALAAPFALGTAQRLLARGQVFLRNAQVLERLARIDTVVFDKTGTLTTLGSAPVRFEGKPLDESERELVGAVVRQSVHPLAVRLAEAIGAGSVERVVEDFSETPGYGIAGRVGGYEIVLGSARYLAGKGVESGGQVVSGEGGRVELGIQGKRRGWFVVGSGLRPDGGLLISELTRTYTLALLSGDHERERPQFERLLGSGADLRFNQTPLDKLEYVRGRQELGMRVMMVGDGLNDAGALRQSEVGVAVVERVGTFSPASDVIVAASRLTCLGGILRLSRRTVGVVIFCFGISVLYNVVGLSVAAAGWLSPVLCAVLMPLSSVSVVLVACGATMWAVRRSGLAPDFDEGGWESGEANRAVRQSDGPR